MTKKETESAKILAAQTLKVTAKNQEIREELQKIRRIDLGRQGNPYCWKVSEIKWKDSQWVLVVEFTFDSPNKIFVGYDLSIVRNPTLYHNKIDEIIKEFENPQTAMFQEVDGYADRIKRIHEKYQEEALLFGIYDFHASVVKYENKQAKSVKQLSFVVPFEAVVHIGEMLGAGMPLIENSALVLSPKIPGGFENY